METEGNVMPECEDGEMSYRSSIFGDLTSYLNELTSLRWKMNLCDVSDHIGI